MTSTKMNTTKMTIAAAAIAATLAFPTVAFAHPLADNATETHVPVAVEAMHSSSPIDAAIEGVVDEACSFAVAEGHELLDAQTKMVSEDVAKSAAESSAKVAEARRAADVQATTTTASSVAAASTGAAAAETQSASTPAPRTINVDGDSMSYVSTYLASTAPQSGAGLWMGSDSTTDGTWGYFIGHNPGPFHHVMDLTNGDAVTVTDSAGNSRTYHVVDTFTIADSTYWEEIESRVTGYGESVVLQTCCGDNAHYRVVVAV